jgi:hypothetical protein
VLGGSLPCSAAHTINGKQAGQKQNSNFAMYLTILLTLRLNCILKYDDLSLQTVLGLQQPAEAHST